jgi:hypothetical protein
LKKICTIATLCLYLFLAHAVFAQKVDIAFGVGAVTATPASSAGANYSPQSVGGGAFPAFSGDVLIKKNFGVSSEIAWRASQNHYTFLANEPFRPLFYDFNAIWVPKLAKKTSAELMGGIGAENIRFYQTFFICGFASCTNYTSENHFMGHFGGGIRLYVFGNLFVRPEAHIYLIHNNVDFSGPWAVRYGASVGYTFGGSGE